MRKWDCMLWFHGLTLRPVIVKICTEKDTRYLLSRKKYVSEGKKTSEAVGII